MMRLEKLWDSLRTSLWFVPALTTVAAAGLAMGVVAIDSRIDDEHAEALAVLYAGGPDGARRLLGTVAGAIITVIGVVFSVTIVSLQLAARQFGSRLLRTFMRDVGTQLVLGTLMATFVFAMLVLRTVKGDDGAGDEFVPHLAVTVTMLLTLASVSALIYFIHHVAVSIQAEQVVASVARELQGALDEFLPERAERDASARPIAPALPHTDSERVPVAARTTGYVQAVETEKLIRAALAADVVVWVERPPGRFVITGQPLAAISPGRRLTRSLEAAVARAFVVGAQRTLIQDLEFGVHELVEIAVRALSPSINDPTTAMICIDRLGAVVAHLGDRARPPAERTDEHGRVRVVLPMPGSTEMAHAAFAQIRQYGASSAPVAVRLLEVFADVAALTRDAELRAVLLHHAVLVERQSRDSLPPWDHAAVAERFVAVQRAVGTTTARLEMRA